MRDSVYVFQAKKMYLRIYTVNQKYVKNRYGDIGVYRKKIKKWINPIDPTNPRKGDSKNNQYSLKDLVSLNYTIERNSRILFVLLDIVSVSVSMFCAKCGMDITKQGVMKKVVEEW